MDVAYGVRNRLMTRTRKTAYFALRATSKLQRLARTFQTGSTRKINHVAMVLPASATPKDLGSAVNHLAWYFGSRPSDDVESAGKDADTTFTLLVPRRLHDVEPVAPSAQRDFLAHAPAITRIQLEDADLTAFDALLVWRAADVLEKRFWNVLDKIHVVDASLYSGAECGNYMRVVHGTVDAGATQGDDVERSAQNFREFCARWSTPKPALALGTGPSLAELDEHDFSDHPVIVCNSIVKNDELLERLQPAAICFADPVFHFGPSEYAARFRDDLLKAVERHDAFVITRSDSCRLLLRHHPELAPRLIGLDTNRPPWNVPSADDLAVSPTSNILTLFMIPIATALSDEVWIGGCDGRKPDENYFWKHNASVQYEGLMKTVFETHPSFFRDRSYTDYYQEHCDSLEDQISTFEQLGTIFRSVTSSYIPALATRKRAPRA